MTLHFLTLRPHNQHRQLRRTKHILSHAACHQPFQTSSTMRSDSNQITTSEQRNEATLCAICDTLPFRCDWFVISWLYSYKQVAIVLRSLRGTALIPTYSGITRVSCYHY